MQKKILRDKFKAIRSSFIKGNKEVLDEKIFKNFFQSSLYKEAKNIMSFISFNNEVDTHKLIKQIILDGKNLYVPITNPEKKELLVSKLNDFNQLELGFYNILTPKKEAINIVDKSSLDLVLVPGLVFDRLGYRIGYGGGYYDRFLGDKNLKAKTLGICYSAQLTNRLNYDIYDIPVEYILTEKDLLIIN